jgi:hypothetical protein
VAAADDDVEGGGGGARSRGGDGGCVGTRVEDALGAEYIVGGANNLGA